MRIDLNDLNMKVSLYDILDFLDVKYIDRRVDSQVNCPIHKEGQEVDASARVYHATNSMYCFTCHKTYTPLSLVMARFEFNVPAAVQFIKTKFQYSPTPLVEYQMGHRASRREADNTWIVVHQVATEYMIREGWPIDKQIQAWKDLDELVFSVRTEAYGLLIDQELAWLEGVKMKSERPVA